MKKKLSVMLPIKKQFQKWERKENDKMKKEYLKKEHKIIITKNEKGLYDYELSEYSKMCNCWNKIGKYTNFTKEALETWLDINIDSLEEGATNG